MGHTRQVATVYFTSVKLLDDVLTTSPTTVAFDFNVNGRHLHYPLVGKRVLPVNAPIDLPLNFAVAVEPSRWGAIELIVTLQTEPLQVECLPNRRPPCQTVKPSTLERVYDISTRFGSGAHPDEQSTNEGTGFHFVVSYRIGVRRVCPNCEPIISR